MTKGDQTDRAHQTALQQMRECFAVGDCAGVIAAFAELGEPHAVRSGIRIEAISLAARALQTLGHKRVARELIRTVWDRPMKSHRQYRHLAMACLELGEYRRASGLAASAAASADAERAMAAEAWAEPEPRLSI